ncbi:putative nucleic acid-binding protein [Branchiibius hedensis]|uniref:Ribonuclease VapC n=1 Tax=Branchiibius hedensis TaxID=672460 RepID=A0A2Y8ZUL3_9MICO|nr:type II toxin-antitoxin system VapC family toxin [Branchiibius hedensis]PWJ26804.1 putative nucleic acid-binding protein [Branchiibius hedensis]SSA35615.1 Predicted nucleic acid-binding protein, contains PIN domain [Branchiibius hedensis]
MLVVDAPVLAVALGSDNEAGVRVRSRLTGEDLAAPALVDIEVTSAWRGLTLAGKLDPERAAAAITDLHDLPVDRADHLPLLQRCWELRSNLSTYDASYVALAELLDCTFLTADARIARATGPRCHIEVLAF